MKAVIYDHPALLRIDVYVIDERDGSVARLDEFGRVIEWVPQKPGAEVGQATLRLNREVFGAIADAVSEHTRASDATVEALADTRAVRDRLLALVERRSL